MVREKATKAQVMAMQEAGDFQARLEAAAVATDAVPETLAAALDTFGVLLASCRASEDKSVERFAAFAFAALAAAEGRRILLTAPSLPLTYELPDSYPVCAAADLDVTVGALAGLAGALSAHLSAAAHRTQNPGDRGACTDSAREAAQVHQLLTGGDQ